MPLTADAASASPSPIVYRGVTSAADDVHHEPGRTVAPAGAWRKRREPPARPLAPRRKPYRPEVDQAPHGILELGDLEPRARRELRRRAPELPSSLVGLPPPPSWLLRSAAGRRGRE